MKKVFLSLAAATALVVGFTSCSSKQKLQVTCMTIFGPVQADLDSSRISGLSRFASSYTLELDGGMRITVGKSSCVIVEAPEGI